MTKTPFDDDYHQDTLLNRLTFVKESKQDVFKIIEWKRCQR